MFLTFPQKSHLFYSTNELSQGGVTDNQMSSNGLLQAVPLPWPTFTRTLAKDRDTPREVSPWEWT